MTITGDYVLIGLIFLAGLFTFFAIKISRLLWRLAAAVAWLALGTLFFTNILGTSISDPWVQFVAFALILIIIAILTLQMQTDIRHEAKVRGKLGYPGAETESWQSWGPRKGNKKPTASERQADYKETLRGKTGRK